MSVTRRSKYANKLIKHLQINIIGHGLSYTSIKYSNLRIDKKSIDKNAPATVSVTVENTGKLVGDEVVQFYIHQDYTSLVRPVMELTDFERIKFWNYSLPYPMPGL